MNNAAGRPKATVTYLQTGDAQVDEEQAAQVSPVFEFAVASFLAVTSGMLLVAFTFGMVIKIFIPAPTRIIERRDTEVG